MIPRAGEAARARRVRSALLLFPLFLGGCLGDHPLIVPDEVVDPNVIWRNEASLERFDTVRVTAMGVRDSSRTTLLWHGPYDRSAKFPILVNGGGQEITLVFEGYFREGGYCFEEEFEKGKRKSRRDACSPKWTRGKRPGDPVPSVDSTPPIGPGPVVTREDSLKRLTRGVPVIYSLWADAYQVPVGAPILFSALFHSPAERPLYYKWDFQGDGISETGGGTGSNDYVLTRFAYSSPGKYMARISVSDDSGRFSEDSVFIKVAAVGPRTVYAGEDTVVAAGSSFTLRGFIDSSGYEGGTYGWAMPNDSIPDGASEFLFGIAPDADTVLPFYFRLAPESPGGLLITDTVLVRVVKAPVTPARLVSLVPLTGTLSPPFSGGTTGYTLTVPASALGVILNLEVTDPADSVRIAAPGPSTLALPVLHRNGRYLTLEVDMMTESFQAFVFEVAGQSGPRKRYTVAIFKED
ncbi:MAG TPA: PKD domain-containing protein [Fibrobacteria bacterium]|nr:PKD domain-containing protein [Fibrobacteria bacterium]